MSTQKIELAAMNCHHRFYELEDFFASAKENGYKYVEIWTGPQHFFMDYNGYESVEKLRRLEEKYGIKVIGICPEQTNPKPNNMAAKRTTAADCAEISKEETRTGVIKSFPSEIGRAHV